MANVGKKYVIAIILPHYDKCPQILTEFSVFHIFHTIVMGLEEYLWTNDNQFGFKSGHSTDLCIYTLTEFIEYFKSRSTSVYVAFLDASKAFDKISYWTLFKKTY